MITNRRLKTVLVTLTASLLVVFVVWRLSEVRIRSISESLKQEVIREMADMPFVPQQICALTPMNGSPAEAAYMQARAEALAHMLAAPQARGLGVSGLLATFSEGVQIATGTGDGAFLIDEHDGFSLVSMKLPICAQRHKYYYMPLLYVFDKTGDFWSLGPGIIQVIEWMGDRWVGMMRLQIDEGRERYAFVHVVQEGDEWQLRTFNDASNGPGLMYFPDPDAVDYTHGYHQIAYTSPTSYGPLPCAFNDAFLSMESRDSCHDCLVRASYAVYRGTFTFAWTGDNYRLTDETPYHIAIILSDNTRLEEKAPTEADLAEKSPFLRPGSWRDYCQTISPQKEDFHE